MKVLFLSQGRTIEDHPGRHDALLQLKEQGEIQYFLNIPYLGYAEEHGWDSFYTEEVDLCSSEKYELVFYHYFHKNGVPPPNKQITKIKYSKHNLIAI